MIGNLGNIAGARGPVADKASLLAPAPRAPTVEGPGAGLRSRPIQRGCLSPGLVRMAQRF